ncbi:MAG: glucosaminidase domain-containing protein [Saprospiraceae bacterium]
MNKIVVVLLLLTGSLNAQDFVYDYIERYKSISIEEMNKTGIPASITLAQGMLESNWGRSELSMKANNHFGLKCGGNWDGNTFMWEDDEYHNDNLIQSCFRSFDYPEESFYEHSMFIKTKDRYQFLFDYDITDYKSWAHGLRKAGYATDPNYADKLIKIIEKYGLYEYDMQYMPISEEFVQNKLSEIDNKEYTITYINGSKVVIAKKGDSPVSISKSIGVLAEEILKYNDNIKRKYQLFDDGDYVFIEEKKSSYSGTDSFYYAKKGETLEDVSQKYGVDVKSLAKMNNFNKYKKLKNGEIIKLKNVPSDVNPEKQSWVNNNSKDSRFLFDEPLTPKK